MLAFYGAVAASVHLWLFLRALAQPRAEAVLSILVIVQDQEQQIEGLIRTLAARAPSYPAAGTAAEVVVVDAGSHDHTPLIVERLCRIYNGLRYIRAGTRNPWEAGLQLCAGGVALLVDARGTVPLATVLRNVSGLLGGAGNVKNRKE